MRTHRTRVVAIDDAQLLDPVSAALVLHLASSGTAFVLATVRADDRIFPFHPPRASDEVAAETESAIRSSRPFGS